MKIKKPSYQLHASMMLAVGLIIGLSPAVSTDAKAAVNDVHSLNQAETAVRGTVVDENGEPLIGVTVKVDGKSNGVITDLDGKYQIMASKGARLIFSYIGYQNQIVTVNEKNLNVTMKADQEELQEVVVVGYGTQKKESLTGAVTVVDAKQMENKGTLSSPLQALQGQVPGVIITRSSGAPGDESWGMKLRGSISTNNSDPLVIVDGVEYSDGINGLRLLNAADIESINFLKDASAAIYGSKAAGGVVLVTTKQAKEGKTVIEYNGSVTGKVVGLQPSLMSLDEWSDALIQAIHNDGDTNQNWLEYAQLAKLYKGKYIDLDHSVNPFGSLGFQDVADFVFSDNDWLDTLWGNAWSTSQNLSVSGGNSKNLFRISLGYIYDGSNLQWGNNNNQRYNLRWNDKLEIRKGLKLVSNISYNRQDQVAPSRISDVLTSSTPQPGLPAATIDGRPYAWGTWVSPNWLAELGGDNKLKVSAINISEQLNWTLSNHFDFNVQAGYNTSTATRDIQNNSIEWYNYAGTRVVLTSPTQDESLYTNSFAHTDYYMESAYANYHNTFNGVHNLSVMLGEQYNYMQYKYTSVTIKDINSSLEIPNGSGAQSLDALKYHEAMMSYFGRLNYDYKNRYLFEAQVRYDGSSKFQPENRWKFFWGASAGWRIKEEAFMKNIDWISNLKLRLSYGVVGNQSGIDRYDGTQLYNISTASGALIGNGLVSTIDTNGTLASLNRTWEKIHNYNVGVDFGLFNDRLNGTVEVFYKRNNNMLVSNQYPAVLGDNAPTMNDGKFEAKGWEGNITWSDHIGLFTYHIGGTITYATNKVLDIGTTSVISAGFKSAQQGYPLNSYFGYRYMGKIQDEETLKKYTDYYYSGNTVNWTGTLRLGDNMYEDVNGDGKLDEQDLVYLGTDDPKLSYSFNFGFEWKGFDFSAVFQGVGRRTIWRDNSATGLNHYRVPMAAAYLNSTDASIGNVWSETNRNAYYPTYTNTSWINIYNYQISSWSVEDGAYLRLKNLVIGYTLPESVLRHIRPISKCRIYFAGNDLWETSKIRDGWDPEQKRGELSGLASYPFTRQYSIGLDLTF